MSLNFFYVIVPAAFVMYLKQIVINLHVPLKTTRLYTNCKIKWTKVASCDIIYTADLRIFTSVDTNC